MSKKKEKESPTYASTHGAWVHEFQHPKGAKFRLIFLTDKDVMHHPSSSKRAIHGPGCIMEEIGNMSRDWTVVWGCKVVWYADNYAEAGRLIGEAVTLR